MSTDVTPPLDLTRPSFQDWFMELAFVTAKRGSCRRKRVGAIIVRDRDKAVVAGGYNGAPRGMPDCLEVGCELREIDGKPSCVRTIHAESNALDRAGPMNEPHTLYCTVIPCRDCALRIIQNGWIHRVVYAEYYESRSSKDTETLFANRDPAFIKLMTEKFGPPEETGWVPTPRAELVKIDPPLTTTASDIALFEIQRLRTRQEELLATIARISQENPFPDEIREWTEQRKKLIAEIGSLKAERDELERRLAAFT